MARLFDQRMRRKIYQPVVYDTKHTLGLFITDLPNCFNLPHKNPHEFILLST